jgi:ketosteroid isomerase-like protein
MTTVKPAQQSSPEATTAAWTVAVANRDADALRDLLTDDYELWANGAPAVTGPEAAVQTMRDVIGRCRVEQAFELRDTIAASDWTFQWGVERLTITPLEGGNATTVVQRTMLMFRRGSDGRWRFARGMTNTPAAQAATPYSSR